MATESRPRVFIGSSREGLEAAKALQLNLRHSTHPVLWDQGIFELNHSTLEDLVEKARSFDFAVLLLTPDDVTASKGRRKKSPRDNVLFEAGLFYGALGRSRCFLVKPEGVDLKIASDLFGIGLAEYSLVSEGDWQPPLGPVATQIEQAIGKAIRSLSHGPTPSGGQAGKLSWQDIQDGVVSLIDQMRKDKFLPHLVVAIGRSGAILGGLIAGNMGNLPLALVDRRLQWDERKRDVVLSGVTELRVSDVNRKLLFVIGEVYSAQSLAAVLNHLETTLRDKEYRTASLVKLESAPVKVDYVAYAVGKKVEPAWVITGDYKRV